MLDSSIPAITFHTVPDEASDAPIGRRSMAGPLMMLTTGAIAFVVATSMAVSPLLLPDHPPAETTGEPTQVVAPPVDSVKPAPAEHVVPPVPGIAPPQEATQHPADNPAPPPEPVEQPAPVPMPLDEITPVEEEPDPLEEYDPIEEAPEPAAIPAMPAMPQVPAVQQPRLRDRILSKIPGLDRFAEPG